MSRFVTGSAVYVGGIAQVLDGRRNATYLAELLATMERMMASKDLMLRYAPDSGAPVPVGMCFNELMDQLRHELHSGY